jgi:hypothetical protein
MSTYIAAADSSDADADQDVVRVSDLRDGSLFEAHLERLLEDEGGVLPVI